ALQASDAICSALQLTNFWQDFSEDIPNKRCYLADEWLNPLNISREDVLSGQVGIKQLRPAINQAIGETEGLFDQGYALLPYLPWRLRLQIAATLAGGSSILAATKALTNPLEERPTLGKLDWLKISLSIVSMALRPNYYSKRGSA
ncbi:MAG: squalene/phytoene synthase family protein, partial [Ghiorsea sp.]|nr:squalene/phytoene synthase family protein [Ghiorsea sp.]